MRGSLVTGFGNGFLTRPARACFEALAYSNVWIAASAAANAYLGLQLLGLPTRIDICFLCFCSMFWVYTFAKAVHFDPQADRLNDPERTEFLEKHRIPLISLALAGLVYGAKTCYAHSLFALAIFLFPTLSGLLYDLKFLPPTFPYRRLKDIPGVKGLTVALAWSVLSAGLIACFCPKVDTAPLSFFAIWSFLTWFVNTTFFDLGDVKGDRIEGTRTLPIYLGFSNTRRLLHGLNALTTVFLLGAVRLGIFSPNCAILGSLGLFQWWLLTRARNEDTDLQWECDVASDGVMVLGALLLVITSII